MRMDTSADSDTDVMEVLQKRTESAEASQWALGAGLTREWKPFDRGILLH